MRKLMTRALAVTFTMLLLTSCASYNAWQKARSAEQKKDWDTAVAEYEKALDIDPDNTRFKIAMERAKRHASREHFEKAKSLLAAAQKSNGPEQLRLMQLAGTELEVTVKLDQTNQFAAVELGKVVMFLNEAIRAQNGQTIEQVKKRARDSGVTKAQPPQLNPASDEPISLSFPQETPVKDIYRALGNAFGINILFDQAVKDDRITIELREVTAQQALERVMQAANHFYKVLDEKTIIVVPDNPQARRDYEDLVIRTFYLSNGDAEQVTNVVRTMIEARNVFPLKALNAITIRDTADKVRIAEKIIEANDKAKSEVVVAVELIQLDLNRLRDIGLAIQGPAASAPGSIVPNVARIGADGKTTLTPLIGGAQTTLDELRGLSAGTFTFSIPSVTYTLIKNMGNSELLANPELRISEGEKATLHIGQRIPVPVSTFTAISTGQSPYQPVVSYQYQDVGIKVSMEPRVHHNREVTLKLTVEVSNQGPSIEVPNQAPQPTFATRTIESTIRLKDGETNFLAGLIQENKTESTAKTPFLGDLPFVGRLFSRHHEDSTRTDLVLTMTPHIIRIPDITEDDLAPMWVGTTNNLTFRGVTPRIESQSTIDPFTTPGGTMPTGRQQLIPTTAVQPPQPAQAPAPQPGIYVPGGSAPTDPFRQNPPPPPPPQPQSQLQEQSQSMALANLAPRISPQPASLSFRPGEQKLWTIVGMDLDGLTTDTLTFRYDPSLLDVHEVRFGPAMSIDPKAPPVVTLDRTQGVVKISSSNGAPLSFNSGGELLQLRVQGGMVGDASLVFDVPKLKNGAGEIVAAAISGGRASVE